ncbi:hypothetical protein [Jeotgalibacillus aurantiacus]|uniref:hypothetical protein n=1 Tax=Jeotgalibacillus aurantiacus TaxID=2763266 RepID=UPI001D0A5B14|nr:hypothetical protein [Jeotgalibacillus aurantiacus]
MDKEQHKALAIQLFNAAWDLIDQSERTEDETLEMIRLAQTSRFHWGEAGTHVNWSRGDWQISRAFAEAGNGEQALVYARANERIYQQYGLNDFDEAFVYEALARAYSLLNQPEEMLQAKQTAEAFANSCKNQKDTAYILEQLESIKIQ